MPRRQTLQKKCKYCKETFETCESRSKFCSRSCSASHNNSNRTLTQKTKSRISKAVKKYHKENPSAEHVNECEKCGCIFKGYVQKDRKSHCDKCKRRTPKKGDAVNILEFSKRTTQKILKRANKGCELCGWDKAACDLHHITERSKGGSDDDSFQEPFFPSRLSKVPLAKSNNVQVDWT